MSGGRDQRPDQGRVFDELVDFFDAMARSRWYGPLLQDFAVWAAGDLPPGGRVLDVGCGPGHLLLALAPRFDEAVGLDISPGMLDRAAANARAAGLERIRWVQGDAARLPFADGTFDLAVSSLVLFLLDDPAAAAAELARVTAPGGRAAVLVPSNLCSPDSAGGLARRRGFQGFDAESLVQWSRVAARRRRDDPESLAQLLESAGLEAVDIWPRLEGLALLARGRRPGGGTGGKSGGGPAGEPGVGPGVGPGGGETGGR